MMGSSKQGGGGGNWQIENVLIDKNSFLKYIFNISVRY